MNKSLFLACVRAELKTSNYSLPTEKVSLYWIKGFIICNGKSMGDHKVKIFLNNLAIENQYPH
ncbi:integrase [Colwellia sp. C1TZA3]|uniref:integrase n=1 Tax=Colwellia sp. C1TZA3 TaxID=2508879 RepID=UPI0011B9FDE0|nr:integrase [Colwellia sp. C1TZA3]TWX65490.1 integrase [Colwellia sp. C1TZA3]